MSTHQRIAGVLLHPSSLPGGHGIGDFGPGAYCFIDYLKKAGMRAWQILPLGPVNSSGSPYQAESSFAGNTMLISLDKLVEAGILQSRDLEDAPQFPDNSTDFAAACEYKNHKLRYAFSLFMQRAPSSTGVKSFTTFISDQASWLEDYALFAALKNEYQKAAWWQWADRDIALAKKSAKAAWRDKLCDEIVYQKWLQFVFFVQWGELKRTANAAGIKIVGDVPIYTAHDSADVWAEPSFFEIDPETGEALLMAGAPPDYFCEDGQLWGNPIFKWDKLKDDGYKWWLRRMRAVLSMTDIVRIDHFRGFESYWQVKAGEKTARNGKWIEGPGQDFFTVLKNELGDDLPLIAEDLGVITEEVDKLRTDNDLPGMKILQFAFCEGANDYRPHTYDKNCVVYTGTHDNDTTIGWYAASGEDYSHMGREGIDAERDLARRYMGVDGSNICWDMIRLAMASPANTAIFPMQDILQLGNDSRMNRPGIAEGNWTWRMSWQQFNSADSDYLSDMVNLFDRTGVVNKK